MEPNGLIVAQSARLKRNLAPGTRVTVRGEEWVVRKCTQEPELGDGRVVHCEGVGGFLRGINATFVDAFDRIDVVDPLDIDFIVDETTKFRASKLWIDVWARKVVPVDNSLALGHHAVVDALPYQRVPAAVALDTNRNVRPRILIADAVGLGKTIEVGILLSELIKRGRGRRILVVVLKSMMIQFQKELWSRFAIAFEAVDRPKLERIARNIPRSMNPLDQLSHVIMSMDTLKSDRCIDYLESSNWDVVVIDECHNVARRGGSGSQRSQLARKLAKISEALVLTSATPHDGTSASYASLLELLDPLLVVDPGKITKADLEPVTIQRYAKDTRTANHKERKEHKHFIPLDTVTLEILKSLVGKVFDTVKMNAEKRKDALFRTTLSKSLMSSPEAFVSSVLERLKKINAQNASNSANREDADFLNALLNTGSSISIVLSSKYLHLIDLIKNNVPKKARTVIFTESRKTQTALAAALSKTLGFQLAQDPDGFDKKAQIVVFHGGQSEAMQQEILDDFQTKTSKIRHLIATDVASEGINLHYFCSHLIHYDIPWSLITISQRNGRIDRYGQSEHPEIHYLIGDTGDSQAVKLSERRVVDILVDKAKQAEEALGNVGISLGEYDPVKEAEKVAMAVASDDPLENLFSNEIPDISKTIDPGIVAKMSDPWRPFAAHDLSFCLAATKFLGLPTETDADGVLTLRFDEEDPMARSMRSAVALLDRELNFKKTPSIALTASRTVMKSSMADARAKAGKWPDLSFGWEIHPAVEALSRLIEGRFAKKEARVLRFSSIKGKGFLSFMVYRALFDHSGNPIFCRMQMALSDRDGWRLLDPDAGYLELGLTTESVNCGGVLAKSDETLLHGKAKGLFEHLTRLSEIDAASAKGRRTTLARDEHVRASTFFHGMIVS